ncbi:hypothetical protein [Pseudomarimonas arenosa]|uniref:Uncharacterized protein n=1 Tax=Pseudomarimonas arenosa TaxID=2774145 RepID=A0AAW3ZHT8_9GAMM|nr:hypothetical protein [Pseudomarimonas arenosa]MBD8525353.1 hypothetical protein [Pseudomarimonas arenosa]
MGRILNLRPITIGLLAGEGIGHGILLLAFWWGGLHYVVMSATIAVELVLVNIASAILWPARGLLKHSKGILIVSVLAAFLLMMTVLTFNAADGEPPLDDSLRPLFDGALFWPLLYLSAHLGVLMVLALRSSDPRLTWVSGALVQGAISFFQLFLMCGVAVFICRPLIDYLRDFDPTIPASPIIGSFAVIFRFAMTLWIVRWPEKDLERIARNPYVD